MKNTLLVIIIVGLALGSCVTKSTSNNSKAAYQLAVNARDYNSATSILTQWLAQDSSIGEWAYDSLAFYHYFYITNPNAVRNSSTPMFYVNKGLELKANDEYLKDIKAKLLLEQGKDTVSYGIFEELWKATNNYSYYWDMAFIEIARNHVKEAEAMIDNMLKDPKNMEKKVKMEHIQVQLIEEVPAKAAFLYLHALIQNGQRDVMGAAQSLQESLKISPEFYAAKRSIMDLQRMAAQSQGR